MAQHTEREQEPAESDRKTDEFKPVRKDYSWITARLSLIPLAIGVFFLFVGIDSGEGLAMIGMAIIATAFFILSLICIVAAVLMRLRTLDHSIKNRL